MHSRSQYSKLLDGDQVDEISNARYKYDLPR